MKVLVACEFSGVVRNAFNSRGHEAFSCDLLDSLDNSDYHIKGNVLDILDYGWDLMIAHPPCTYLCNSGVRWLHLSKKAKAYGSEPSQEEADRLNERWAQLEDASKFFYDLLNAPIPKICVENPVPHKYAELPRYDQKVQPWMFGHPEKKGTCFWLKNLDPLQPTKLLKPPYEARVANESPGPDRWMRRSITYQGIADAMAQQWTA